MKVSHHTVLTNHIIVVFYMYAYIVTFCMYSIKIIIIQYIFYMCMHVQLHTYVYVCASVHLGSPECMGIRICGWGCLVHVIRVYIRTYMHAFNM